MENITNKLSKILEIINYEDDKAEYVNNFIILCTREALNRELLLLPADKRQALQNDLNGKEETEDVVNVIQKYLSIDEYNTKVAEVAKEQLNDFVSTIMPTLSDEQMNALSDYLRTNP